MSKLISIKKGKDFSAIYKRGKSKANPLLVMYILTNYKGYNRIGISISVKVGKSVLRNRIKRLIKEVYRKNLKRMEKGYDIILIVRPRAKDAKYNDIERWMLDLLTRHKLIEKEMTR